jgi:hypothetical protein
MQEAANRGGLNLPVIAVAIGAKPARPSSHMAMTTIRDSRNSDEH